VRKPQERLPLSNDLLGGIGNLAAGQVANLLLSLLSFVLITRMLSTDDYGRWATVLNATAIVLGIAAVGLPLATVLHISGIDGAAFVLPTLLLRMLATTAAVAVTFALTLLPGSAAEYTVPGLAAAPGVLFAAMVAGYGDVLRARRRYQAAALVENASRLLLVIALVAALLAVEWGTAHPSVTLLLWLWTATWFAAAVAGLPLLRPATRERPASVRRRMLTAGRSARLLSIVTLVAIVRLRLDVVLLGLLRSSSEAAHFSVASRVYGVALVAPDVVAQALFPYLLHVRSRSPVGVRGEIGRVLLLTVIAGCIVSVVLIAAAPFAVTMIAGSQYAGAAGTTRVLAALVAPAYLLSVLTVAIVERGGQRQAALALVLPLVVAYAVELVFVPKYGASVCLAASSGAILVSCLLMCAAYLGRGVTGAGETSMPTTEGAL